MKVCVPGDGAMGSSIGGLLAMLGSQYKWWEKIRKALSKA